MKAKTGGNFKPVKLPDPQTTVARCYSMIDIGTVPNIFNGKLDGTVHKVHISWELPKLKAVFSEEKGPQPFGIFEEMTLSTKENSNLAKLVAAWRGRPFTVEEQKGWDPSIMVGKTCLMQISHATKAKFKGEKLDVITNENTVLKLSAIMSKPKDMECPAQINEPFIWDWEKIESKAEAFSTEKWDRIPNFIQDKMKESEEYKRFAPGTVDNDSGADQSSGTTSAPTPIPGPVSNEEW